MAVSETDLVPSEWSDGEEMTVEEWGQREFNSGLRTGREDGVKMAAALLDKIAAELFLKRDQRCEYVRELAQQLRTTIGG